MKLKNSLPLRIEQTVSAIYDDMDYWTGIEDEHLAILRDIVHKQNILINYLLQQSVTRQDDIQKKIKIDECPMSPRLANLMCNFGYEYLEDVYDYWVLHGDWGLLKKSSFGRKSLNELKDIFKEYELQETKNND